MENEQVLTPPVETTPEVEQKPVNEDGLFDRMWARIQAALTPAKEQQAFTVFKDKSGVYRWHAVYSNDFEDRDKEIVSAKAHEAYIARVDMGLIPMPKLMTWHTKGTEHGQTDILFRSGHFTHAIGHFDDTDAGRKSIAFYRKRAKDRTLSHGFVAPKWAFKNGIYEVANTFEISTLPKGAEANSYTYFEELKDMAVEPRKRPGLVEQFGEEFVQQLEQQDEQRGKALEAAGVEFKDFAAVTPAVAKEIDSTMAEMYLETTKAQGDLATMMIAYKKATDSQIETLNNALQSEKQSHQKAIEGFTAEVSELRKMVNAGPRAASQDAATAVDKLEVDKLKAKAPNADSKTEQYQAFMGLPVSPLGDK